jgi:hypothetical protein
MGRFLGETILWRPKNGFPQSPFQESHKNDAAFSLSQELPFASDQRKERKKTAETFFSAVFSFFGAKTSCGFLGRGRTADDRLWRESHRR